MILKTYTLVNLCFFTIISNTFAQYFFGRSTFLQTEVSWKKIYVNAMREIKTIFRNNAKSYLKINDKKKIRMTLVIIRRIEILFTNNLFNQVYSTIFDIRRKLPSQEAIILYPLMCLNFWFFQLIIRRSILNFPLSSVFLYFYFFVRLELGNATKIVTVPSPWNKGYLWGSFNNKQQKKGIKCRTWINYFYTNKHFCDSDDIKDLST